MSRAAVAYAVGTVGVMTEWELQAELADRWGRAPFLLGQHLVRLLAWEVMTPSWQINDASALWAEPSVDFVGVTAEGALAAIEIKRAWGGPVSMAQAAAQAAASAMRLRSAITVDRLQFAYQAARTGVLGRVPLQGPDSVALAVSGFVQGRSVAEVLAAPVLPLVVVDAVAPVGAPQRLGINEIRAVLERSVQRESVRLAKRLDRALVEYPREMPLDVEFVRVPIEDVE